MKKFNVKIKTTIAVILSLLCLNLSSVQADDSDIFGANIEPNVMILIDTSGTMWNEIPSTSYDPATTYSTAYSGSKQSAKVYKPNSNDTNYSVYSQTVAEVPNANAITALNEAGYWTGTIGGSNVSLFTGNYINFQNCTTCTGTEQKIEIAKRVVSDLVKYVDGIRFGVMDFVNHVGVSNELNGRGGMVAPIGTDRAAMVAAVDAITVTENCCWTPTGPQLYDAGQYFKGTYDVNGASYPTPIQYACQPNFVIIISDGIQTGPTLVEDEATNVYSNPLTNDHSLLDGLQNVVVHTIGFDITGDTVANDSLIAAAANGGGTFFTANNSAELAASLQDAIRLVMGAVFTFATPVVPTTSTTGSTRAYVGAIQSDPDSVFWKGYLKAYDRQADGSILLNADGTPDSSQLAWEAGDVLNNRTDARKIYYQSVPVMPGQPRVREDFVWNKVPPGLLGLAPSDTSERDDIVNFIRGVDVFDEDGDANITENRAWILGDIFHSTPVLVSQPRMPIVDSSYDDFKALDAVINRPSVLIVGANDGMLHAFRESDGEELWAWVPEHVFPNLKDLLAPSGEHPYFVDGSPVSADIKIDGQWETIVVFGLRRGGRHYYALKITDTTSPTLLWNFNDPNLGETWSEPSIGKIKWSDGTDKYVAFVGGGYDTWENNASGKAFFMIDLEDGTRLAEYYNDGSTDDRQYMNFSIPANPTAIDKDGDGYVDQVYIGDVGGQLWRFDPTITSGTTTPVRYKYSYAFSDGGSPPPESPGLFSIQLTGGATFIIVKDYQSVVNWDPPLDCSATCYAYSKDGTDPTSQPADWLGYIGGLDGGALGGGFDIYNMAYIETVGGTSSAGFTLKGKRLFAADSNMVNIGADNPPPVGEYLPAQAIYGAPSAALDDKGNLWIYFGTGDRNHPLAETDPQNRFYGIKDNALIDDVVTLTESDLQLVDGPDDVCTSEGWYFAFEGNNEKVLGSAETFDNTVYFTTFTPDSDSSNVCDSSGGAAKLYAVRMTCGFAALNFGTANNDAYAATAKEVGTSRWTKIGDGIPSKPAVIIDKYGNPSIITGTTSQQVSSEKAPKISNTGLLGWMEVFGGS